jgi:hypothetical protein
MIIFQLTPNQLDSIETNPQMTLHTSAMPYVTKGFRCGEARSDADQRLENLKAWGISWFTRLLTNQDATKKVRVRLKPTHFGIIRQRQQLIAKSRCPFCQAALGIYVKL